MEKIVKNTHGIVLWELPVKLKRVNGKVVTVYLRKKNKWVKLPEDDDIVIDLKKTNG